MPVDFLFRHPEGSEACLPLGRDLRVRKVRANTTSFPHKDLSLVHDDELKPWNLIPKKLILV